MFRSGATLLLLLGLMAAAQARAQVQTLWNCKDKDGRTMITSQKADTAGRDCRVVSEERVSTVPSNKGAKSPANFPKESTSDRAAARVKQRETLESELARKPLPGSEWRVHFHIPLHSQLPEGFETTADHILGVLKELQAQPQLCSHLEMETYTWSVLPEPLKTRDVSDQLVSEYQWTLKQLADYGLNR